MLGTTDHDRGAAGMTYVYPVVSRRARGISVGINLNPNQACNWRCVYCQVPNLTRGAGPEVDLTQLESELEALLDLVMDDAWREAHVPEESRRLNDLAFSGDGEPTTSPQFAEAIERVLAIRKRRGIEAEVVLITNGSGAERPAVRDGLERLGAAGGQVWFKLDRGDAEGRRRWNDTAASDERVERDLVATSAACPTRLQTLMARIDDEDPSDAELDAWIQFVARAREAGARIQDVLLYGLARPSQQPEAPRLSPVSAAFLQAFADRITAELSLPVHVSP